VPPALPFSRAFLSDAVFIRKATVHEFRARIMSAAMGLGSFQFFLCPSGPKSSYFIAIANYFFPPRLDSGVFFFEDLRRRSIFGLFGLRALFLSIGVELDFPPKGDSSPLGVSA